MRKHGGSTPQPSANGEHPNGKGPAWKVGTPARACEFESRAHRHFYHGHVHYLGHVHNVINVRADSEVATLTAATRLFGGSNPPLPSKRKAMTITTWRKLLDERLKQHGETWDDVESSTLKDEDLDVEFNSGYGGS